MFALDLLSENTKIGSAEFIVEGLGEEFEPGMEGISEMATANLRDQFLLESAVMLTSNKQAMLISEGAQSEAVSLSESVVSNIFKKVSDLIKKMWARMKDFFKGVRIFFDKLIMKEAEFANKYEKEIKAIKTVKVEGHDLKPENISMDKAWKSAATLFGKEKDAVSVYTGALSGAKDEAAAKNAYETLVKSVAKTEDFKKTLVASVVPGATPKDFKAKALNLIGMKPAKISISFTGSEIFDTLSKLNNAINSVKDNEKAVDAAYQGALSSVDSIAKVAGIDKVNPNINASWFSKGSSVGNSVAANVKASLDIVNTISGLQISALKTNAGLAKTAAYKGIAENRKSGDGNATPAKKTNSAVSESFASVSSLYSELLN